MISYLHKLFNVVFEKGYFPSKWTEGFIVPLHKKGDVNLVENYRGITLLSTLGKLFSRILNNRLVEWAEEYSVYVEAQAGFRKHMGTVDNVFVLHGLITHLLNENKKLYAAFIDFTKAFDYVVRENMWSKLLKVGIRGKVINVIRSMYENIKSRVKSDNNLSNDFSCLLGVRQGECLSPFLFSMYVNDLEETLVSNNFKGIEIGMLKMFLLLYADDIIIFSDTEYGLQRGLDILKDYCNKWKLIVNINKTKIMVFRNGGILRKNLKFTYDGNDVEIVKKFTYLGVVFTTGGSFYETHESLSGQALKAIFKLKAYVNKFTNISISHMLALFDKLILPILTYGSEVSGFSKGDSIERIHLQFCKHLLGVKIQTQNDFIYGELGRVPVRIHRVFAAIRFWFKILHSKDTKYIRLVYNLMIDDLDNSPEKLSWAKSVKTVLKTLGFGHVWLSQGVGDVNMFWLFLNKG